MKTKAPFNDKQVKLLEERQNKLCFHEYTCKYCNRKLKPDHSGLICEEHGLVQDWVWYADVEEGQWS